MVEQPVAATLTVEQSSVQTMSTHRNHEHRHLGVLVAMFLVNADSLNRHQKGSCLRVAGDLRRLAKSPDGTRYEVVGSGKHWKLGTGSVLLDAAAFVWCHSSGARQGVGRCGPTG